MYFCPKLQLEILQTTYQFHWSDKSHLIKPTTSGELFEDLFLAIIWDSQFPLNFVEWQKLTQQISLMSKTNLHWHFGEKKKLCNKFIIQGCGKTTFFTIKTA